MALLDLTAESLTGVIGQPVPDLYVVIAKNSVLEMDTEGLCSLLGINEAELSEITEDEVYKQVRLLVASEQARSVADRDTSWDSLEETALRNLSKRIKNESDPEMLLKVAAVANKAQRRIREQRDRTLDPTKADIRIPLRLTQRIVKKLNNGDSVEETREISVLDGSAVNPSFAEIDQIMGLTQQPIPSPALAHPNVRSQGRSQDQPASWPPSDDSNVSPVARAAAKEDSGELGIIEGFLAALPKE